MARYIDQDKALEEFDAWVESTGALPKGTSYYAECRGCIEDIPAADVAPVRHGRWEDAGAGYVACSECGEEHSWIDFRASYCDNCGAKMDGEAVERKVARKSG